MAEVLDWLPFFVMTTAAAVPGLLLLLWLSVAGRRGTPVKQQVVSPE